MISLELLGAEKFLQKTNYSETMKPAAKHLLKNLTVAFERDVKKATVVDSGRLKSSIMSEIKTNEGIIQTNVKYAPFVEFGTSRMEARHMEGSSKKLGKGAFTFVEETFKKTAKGVAIKVATLLEGKWK
ncbi:hypothetical protein CMI37_13890 [Candidatus Pacearchaeota archaeon]|nr:hypothetical protein [Candidatus Pacearchaeota archaeon]|tara:strand:- start:1226 stop:1612 length:387 start_codon:yes stop_codon:yes gene_type:complete